MLYSALPILAVCGLLPLSIHLALENSRLAEIAEVDDDDVVEDMPVQPRPRVVRMCPPAPTPVAEASRSFQDLRAQYEAAPNLIESERIVRDMGDAGSEALGFLTERMEDKRYRVRRAAAEAVGRIGGLGAAGILENALYAGKYGQVSLGAHGLSVMSDDFAEQLLIRSLEDERTLRFRGSVLEALASIGTDNAVGAVTQVLYEGSGSTPRDAARALASTTAGLQILMDAAGSYNPLSVRQAAVRALSGNDSPKVDALFARILRDPRSQLRVQVIEALGDRKTPETVRTLASLIRTAQRGERAAAFNALAKLDTPETAELLARAVRTVGRNDRSNVIYALGRMNTPTALDAIRRLIFDPAPDIHRTAAGAVSYNHPALLAALDPAEVPFGARTYVYRAMVQVDAEKALPILAAVVQGDDLRGARIALQALSGAKTEGARTILIEAVGSPEPTVAQAALQSLGGIRALPEPARSSLVSRIAAGDVSTQLLYSLGDGIGGTDVRDALASAVRSGDRQIRDAAAQALARGGAPGTSGILGSIATDQTLSKSTRLSALNALANSGDPESGNTLVAIARDGDEQAIGALRRVDSAEAIEVLVELTRSTDKSKASKAFSALSGSQRPEATAALVEAVRSGDANARSAVHALANRSSKEARQLLLDTAWSGPKELRTAALQSMSYNVPDGEVMPLIENALGDSDNEVVQAALSVVEYRPGKAASEVLAGVLDSDASDAIRKRAAHALQRRGGAIAAQHKDTIEGLIKAPNAPQILFDFE